MSKETAKQFVLERYKGAFSIRETPSRTLIYARVFTVWGIFAQGVNFRDAWQNAKAKIEEMEKQNER